ncbi:CDP-alcohol phosphatidyltransferase family protein [Sulfurimonas sp.]|uniref:CDP-alcohol phosphatidyltransferase family protein n=1 Tax=Sulfurimonas sp. TaxID=2022749 RepID=UPI003D09EDA8
MATIYDLKPKFQNLLRPIVNFLAHKHVTPNQVTWAAFILSISFGLLIAFTNGAMWSLLFVPVVMFVRMALNAIDGMLAKEHNMQTKVGAILNEMSDVIADTALYLPLIFVSGINDVVIILFVITGILTEMAGVLSASLGGERRYDGPMGKSDRAFVFGFVCLVLGFGIEAGVWVDILLGIATILGVLTVLNRCKGALQ